MVYVNKFLGVVLQEGRVEAVVNENQVNGARGPGISRVVKIPSPPESPGENEELGPVHDSYIKLPYFSQVLKENSFRSPRVLPREIRNIF